MKKPLLIAVLIVVFFSALVAILAHIDYGYVLITNGQWTFENSLSVALIIAFVALPFFYFAMRLLLRIWKVPSLFRKRRDQRSASRARGNINRGLIELLEGHWQQAEQILLKDIDNSDTVLLNYLLAARAAQQQGANDRRDEYLKKAHDSTPKADIAIGLTQAELQLAHEQTEQALATLTNLREIAPKHPYVLKMLSRLYAQLNEWEKLAALLPELRRRKILTSDKLLLLERTTYTQFLRFISQSKSVFNLEEQWKLLPRRYRNDPEILAVYIDCLIDTENEITAEHALRQYLNREWDEQLVQRYGELVVPDLTQQLDYAEAWLKDHGRSPMLLLTLARLCSRLRLWGKSRVYYESAIAIHPTGEGYAELSELLESLGETDSAHDCLRKGIQLTISTRRNRRSSDQTNASSLIGINPDIKNGDKIVAAG
ncbi:MAG: heme biosynthesis protein HemY [Gammaproteobacteria bacterium]|nr:heme biosynthesis protein HemY [Gammaproteobacteria bacterium]